MCKALFLTISFILAGLAFTSSVAAPSSFDCPAENCSYLPLIGNPPPAVVVEIIQRSTKAGTFRFTGDVLANRPLYDVVVEVRFLDNTSDPRKVSQKVILPASLPGELNPFDIYTNIEAYAVIPLDARVIAWKEEGDQIYRKVTVASVSYDENPFASSVTAELRNDEAKPLLDVQGVIWSIYQDWTVTPINIADSLAPGGTIKISQYLYGAHYPFIHVSAQGILQHE
jgi:hypothetical protein